MKKPKFRAWFTTGEEMIVASDILVIDLKTMNYLRKKFILKKV